MRQIAARGELEALVPERVWQETQRALEKPAPRQFFEVLREAHALEVIFPEIHALYGVPQPERWHPEIDTGLHT
jgi:tRNA nucleotidyltransferase (CCA-adding enzyme)